MPAIDHAFDEDEGIALHDHAVGEGAAVAFVGIADDVFLRRRGLRHRPPLDAGRKAGAAAAAQAGLHHLLDDGFGPERERALQPGEAAMAAVVRDRERVGHATAREGEPRLPLEPGDVGDRTERKRVRPAGERRREHGGDVARRHRAIGDAPRRRLDLDQRLQPVEPARAVAHDLDVGTAGDRGGEGRSDLVRTDGERAGVARNVDAGHRSASATSASSRFSSSRPTTRPSNMADGATAQSPRQ